MQSPFGGGSWSGARGHRSVRHQVRPRARQLQTEPLEERRLLAATPQLLADIGVGDGSDPGGVEVNGVFFFSAMRGDIGRELWKSDGTPGGTQLVKDISPVVDASPGSWPTGLINVNGTLFFVADDGITGRELWKSDGTEAGTVLVKDIRPGSADSTLLEMVDVGGTLYFTADDGVHGRELWKSDGTQGGTVLVKDFRPDTDVGTQNAPDELTNFGGVLVFSASTSASGRELWKSDGTEVGTVQVKELFSGASGSSPSQFVEMNGSLFFSASSNIGGIRGSELWKTDGTTAGTVPVKDILGLFILEPTSLVNVDGTLFFAAKDGENGKELWKSDGTAAGTVLVLDIFPGTYEDELGLITPFSSNPERLTNVSGTLYFTASDEAHGAELWKSDGTAAGTVLVKDIHAGTYSGTRPLALTNVNGTLFFAASSLEAGAELWKSDGSEAGTVMVADIYPGSKGSVLLYNTIPHSGGKVFLPADDGVHGRELWISDGTSEGTQLVDINTFSQNDSSPRNFVDLNGITFFETKSPANGLEIWKTDGTTEGTELFLNVDSGPGSSATSGLTRVGDTLYFSHDGGSGRELWKTDGTLGGTSLVKDLNPNGHSDPFNLVNVNGTLFFMTRDGLWKSDGTEAGTIKVKTSTFQRPPVAPRFVVVGDYLYVAVDDGIHGAELWKFDRHDAGTMLVADIRPGALGGGAGELVQAGGTIYFTAYDDMHGAELWKTDGTAAGTTLVKDIRPGSNGSEPISSSPRHLTVVGNTVYFTVRLGMVGSELWKTDGTSAGTVRVKDIYEGHVTSGGPGELTAVGDALFFTMVKVASGVELWKSDGTEEGTGLVKDIFPGSGHSNPDHLTNVAGTLYFWANDGTTGIELWRSDGTAGGTIRVSDLRPGNLGSYPLSLTNVNGALYFSADDGTTGEEPWIIPAEVNVVGRQLFYNNSAFDGGSAGAEVADDGAIAAEKVAYLPGSGLTTTDSVSSYSRGINGLMIDVANLDGTLTADDFTFRIGTSNAAESWALAPAPLQVIVRAGAGIGGSDRVTITWADGAIKNTWLQVTVKGNDAAGGFNTNTGLAESDVFYFGSRVGDTFIGATALATMTNIQDELAARFNPGIVSSPTSLYDFNRDGLVNIADQLIARNNAGILLMLDIEEFAESLVAESETQVDEDSHAYSALAFALATSADDDDSADDWFDRD